MLKIILLLSAFTFAKIQGEKVNRAEEKKRLMAGCLQYSQDVADKKKAICDCILLNVDKKTNDHQLKIIADKYNQKNSDTETEVKPASAIDNFDYDVATECTNNPKWKIKD